MLVPRNALRSFFEAEGYDKNALISKVNSIRDMGIVGSIDKRIDKDYWFYYTSGDKLPEQPINIIVRKNIYRKLSILSGVIQV